MQILSHLWVIPITGPNAGRGRTCYVCQLGSKPVIAAFIRPDSYLRDTYMKHVQEVYNDYTKLEAFIVILGGPDEGLKEELIEASTRLKLSIPINLIDPAIGLPDTLSIQPDAHVTIIMYRGRHIENVVEISPDQDAKMLTYFGNASPKFESISFNRNTINNESAHSTPMYHSLTKAAGEMLTRE